MRSPAPRPQTATMNPTSLEKWQNDKVLTLRRADNEYLRFQVEEMRRRLEALRSLHRTMNINRDDNDNDNNDADANESIF